MNSFLMFSFQVKTASEEQIHSHLDNCDEDFSVRLSQRTNITEYAKKIYDQSVTFEAWYGGVLIGLVAAYINDLNFSGYITNVTVERNFVGKGIAMTLMNMCIEYARKHYVNNITLEVLSGNYQALCLYEMLGFKKTETQGNSILMNLVFSEVKKEGL